MEHDEQTEFYFDDDEAVFIVASERPAFLVRRNWPRDAVLVQKEG